MPSQQQRAGQFRKPLGMGRAGLGSKAVPCAAVSWAGGHRQWDGQVQTMWPARRVCRGALGPEMAAHAAVGTEARLTHTLPADLGGSRAAACGPLLKRSHSFPLPSVHEEIADNLSQAQAGDQAAAAPPGEDRPHAHGSLQHT